MEQYKIDRINALAKKKKEEGLTEEELKEQKELYAEYIQGIRRSFGATLDSTVIVRPDGSKEAVSDRKGKKAPGIPPAMKKKNTGRS